MTEPVLAASDSNERGLTKMTVNLLPISVDALTFAACRSGNSKTDTVNRALQAYEIITRPLVKMFLRGFTALGIAGWIVVAILVATR